MANTLTLADVAAQMDDPLTKGSFEMFLKKSRIAPYIPKKGVDTMVSRVRREAALPTFEWRALGEGWTDSKGSWDYVEESVYSMGRKITIDHLTRKDKRLTEDPIAAQLRLFSKAAGYEFNDAFLHGDPSVDADQPLGLKARLALMDAAQTIDAGSNSAGAMVGDGTDFNLDTAANRATNAKALIDLLEYACDQVTDGEPDLILVNELTLAWINSCFKQTGYYSETQDIAERTVTKFRGAPILNVGRKSDRKTPLISNTEFTNGTGIYILKLGDDALHLLEYEPYNVTPPKTLEDNVTVMASIEWAWGIANPDPTGIAVIKNVKVA